jgi:hypothetical protein
LCLPIKLSTDFPALALAARAQRGGSYHVHASLCQSAMWLQRHGLAKDRHSSVRQFVLGFLRLFDTIDGYRPSYATRSFSKTGSGQKRKKRKLERQRRRANVRPQASIVPVEHFGFGGGMTDGLQDIIQEVGDDLLEAVETVRKTPLLFSAIKTITLPRQARDKHK